MIPNLVMADVEITDETVETKRELVRERLQRREEERMALIEKKRTEKENTSVINENTSYFTETFTQAKVELQAKFDESKYVDKSSLPDHFASISNLLQQLQKYMSDSVMFLPSYDIRVAQGVLKYFQEQLQKQQDEMLPKKKFTFQMRKKEKKEVVDPVPEQKESDVVDLVPPPSVALETCGLQDVVGQRLSKQDDEIDSQDVGLYRLKDCEVRLFGCPSTVHMSGLQLCRIFCGPVKTSIFIDNCRECTFVVACQQLRCHTTTDCDFYLHVTSNPIIEDCSRIRFAPYNLEYSDMEIHFKKSGFDKSVNNWLHVNDFNWLAADAPSPNWKTIPDVDRVQDWHVK